MGLGNGDRSRFQEGLIYYSDFVVFSWNVDGCQLFAMLIIQDFDIVPVHKVFRNKLS